MAPTNANTQKVPNKLHCPQSQYCGIATIPRKAKAESAFLNQGMGLARNFVTEATS